MRSNLSLLTVALLCTTALRTCLPHSRFALFPCQSYTAHPPTRPPTDKTPDACHPPPRAPNPRPHRCCCCYQASETQKRLARELLERGIVDHRFVRCPPEYYDHPLEFRRGILNAHRRVT